MAEQTLEVVRHPIAPAAPPRSRGPNPAEALRQARTCLETADKRLRRGDATQADEVLRLLQNATDLLECALFTDPRATDWYGAFSSYQRK